MVAEVVRLVGYTKNARILTNPATDILNGVSSHGLLSVDSRVRRGTLWESMDCCHLLTICLELLRAIVDLGTTPLFSLRRVVHKNGAV